ncbi:MAG: hypothetical protein MJ154_02240 [Candidatus Saccharibacteria bacterium]|nr:hypothetical protein [Candidatus Saccharibacteria bacterium]
MTAKPKFTFKNYLKEVKKCWILLVVALVIGAGAGAAYSFSRPTNYGTSAKLSVFNYEVNTGSATSPYSQIGDLLMSKELNEGDLSSYEVVEKPFGVFEITVTAESEEKAISTANSVMENADKAINVAFGEDAKNYKVTVLKRASEASQVLTMKSRIISTAIIVVGLLALALIAIFIKFDYSAEK